VLEIALTGEPYVRSEGRPWRFKVSNTAWVLLAMLATSERPSTREQLAAILWPGYDRAEGLTNLRRHLHMIAHGLPPSSQPWILVDAKTAAWNHAAPATIDAVEFERLLARGADRDAVAMYRGDLLPLSYEEIIVAKRERLRAAYLASLERLIAASSSAREFSKVLEYSERLLAADEWREEAVRAWMIAKYESGDGSAALAMYARLVSHLRDEFSAEPAPPTRALRDLISAGSPLPKSTEATADAAAEAGERAPHAWKQPFVGRVDPLDQLGALWSRTMRGSGGVAFISGEAGIGKSRLASEFAQRVRERGGRVLFATTSNPESEPYEAVAAALRSAVDASMADVGDVWLATLARVIPELHNLRTGLTAPEETSITGARERLFEAFTRALEHLGRERPLCLILDDLHWAGPGTIDLVAALSRRLGTLPVALVAAYRDAGSVTANDVASLRTRLVRERRAIGCSLDGLSSGEVAFIVDAGVGDASDELRASVGRLSEGNPLFVAQLVANHREMVSHPHETTQFGDVGEAIAARLRLLDPSVRGVAETAATIGESFRVDVLAAAGGWDEQAVLLALGSLMDRAIVRESGGTYERVFAHALFATTLYTESLPERRTARHRRIAAVLERDLGDDAATAGSVARHWKLAGELERAARLYLRAAKAALAVYARAEAIAFARDVLLLSRDRDDRFAAGLLISRAQHGHSDPRQWQQDLDALFELVSDMNASERFAALEQRETYFNQVGDRTNQHAVIQSMLELTKDGSSPHRRIAALFALGKMHAARSELVESIGPLREAANVAQEIAAGDDLCEIRERLAHAYARLGRYPEAAVEIAAMRESLRDNPSTRKEMLVLRADISVAMSRQSFGEGRLTAERLASIASEIGDFESEITARIELAWAAQFDSDVPSVRANYDTALELAERMGYAKAIAGLLMDRGSFEHRIGNSAGAIAFYDRAIVAANESGSPTLAATCLANRSVVLSIDGDPAEALASALEACDVAARFGDRRLKAGAKAALAMATIAGGDLAGGLEIMSEAIAIRRDIVDAFGLAENLCSYAETLLALGRDDEAAPCLDEIRNLYEADPEQCEYPARTCYLLCIAARKRGDEREARSYLRRGMQLLAREVARAPDEDAKGTLNRRPFNRKLRELAAIK
jgi:DNA-binding SARP family transcriptional activator/tetratricopeptide (TPR) repeat protein